MRYMLLSILILTLAACAIPVDAPPDPTQIVVVPTEQTVPTLIVAPPTLTVASATPVVAPSLPSEISLNDVPALLASMPESANSNLCQDTRGLQLLLDLQKVIQTRDGSLFALLVNPASGMGVRYIRDGNIITYFDNIKFIFETTYAADWGLAAGSGMPVQGSFQEIVLPSLERVFSSNPLVTCNQLKTGGATYNPTFPYSDMDYYSIHFPGSEQYGYLDWETWVVGVVQQDDKPMLAALIRFAWEP